MAANSGSNGPEENEGFIRHENATEMLGEGRGGDMSKRWMPKSGGVLEPVMTLGTTWTLTMIPVPTSMVRPK